MKTYKERTQAVLKKVDEYNNTPQSVVDNGGGTLSIKRNKKIALWSAFAAACLAIIIAFNLVLFLPFPVGVDISAYKDSEYYNLISVINGISYKPRYKNNYEKWTAGFKNYTTDNDYPASDGISSVPMAPDASGGKYETSPSGNSSSGGSSGNGSYQETTNNQVKGVTEADLLKRSDKYAFYLNPFYPQYWLDEHLTLCVYELKGSETKLTASYVINEESSISNYPNTLEMYLSNDCNTVTVISSVYDKDTTGVYTRIISLDVSDVNKIKETSRVYVSGSYLSSRLKDGKILLFTNFAVYQNPDFSDKTQFLPSTGTPDNMQCLPSEEIVYYKNATSARYTVVCSIDEGTLEINSHYAFLSFSDEVYVSEENIFLTRTYSEQKPNDDRKYDRYTEINCVNYAGDGLEYVNKAEAPGFVLNQYSMDEYDGVFRIVTEVSSSSYSGASLFCIDLKNFEICASLEEFAPNGESVKSVRFDGKTAYVCTAIQYIEYLRDPVFAIDLSDLDNITYKDTGTITGYSMSLIKFKGDTLLGIGYGEWTDTLKIELYRETSDGVESVASFEKDCYFSGKFKAYYIDAENGLVGLGIYDWHDGDCKYLLLLFDGYELNVVETLTHEGYVNYDFTRTAYADGYIYVFTHDGLDVINWNA